MGEASGVREDLPGVDEVARYLEVRPITVYRWCREGRLPCTKIGKSWRIRRSALEEFVRRGERRRTLSDQLRAFLTVPDHIVAVAEDQDLLMRLDAAFFVVGAELGGLLVKFHSGEIQSVEELRAGLRRHGLEVDRLEAEGRFRWSAEVDPASGPPDAIRRLMAEEADAGRPVWVSFNWTRHVSLEAVLRQQADLAALVQCSRLVVKTAALETVADEWPPDTQRRVLRTHRGHIQISKSGLLLSRVVPLPEA